MKLYRRLLLSVYIVPLFANLAGALLLDPAWSAENESHAESSLQSVALAQPLISTAPPIEQTSQPAPLAASPSSSANPDDAECIAKVIIHEAGNQSHLGKIAIAQVIHARVNNPRFPKTACAVVNQTGQFFNVNAYNPSRTTALWQESLAIATDSLNGLHSEVVPGALFFHAVGTGMSGRRRVAQIEGHIFYR